MMKGPGDDLTPTFIIEPKKDGNIVRLWSDADIYDGHRELLTLQEKDGNYYIKSFQNIADGE